MIYEGYLSFFIYLLTCYPLAIILRNYIRYPENQSKITPSKIYSICFILGNLIVVALFGLCSLAIYYIFLSLPVIIILSNSLIDRKKYIFKFFNRFGSILGIIWCLGIVFLYHLSSFNSQLSHSHMDISSILMIGTIKITGLINDSCYDILQFNSFLSAVLELSAYLFFFPGLASGPLCRFNTFRKLLLVPNRGKLKLFNFKFLFLVC